MTDVAIRPTNPGALAPDEFDGLYRQAKVLAASGMFKDAQQAEAAFAKLVLGRDFGLSPTQAMTAIHVVEGKPELSANLQAAMLRAYRGPAGEQYDYRVVEHTGEACVLRVLFRPAPGAPWEELGVERFDMSDAERAGLTAATKAGKPSMYAKYPRNMLFARAISNAIAFHCPEVTFGHRVYGPGEVAEHEPGFDPVSQTLSVVREPEPEQVRDVPADVDADVVDADVVEDQGADDTPAPVDEPLPDTGPFDPTPAGVIAAFNATGAVGPDGDTRNVAGLEELLDEVRAPQGPSQLERIQALDERQAATVIAGLA